ncbi:MAG: type II toxin-antitoxin system death-on-curing family toxin [Clostridia bacterium]|nr:type II toxin-antitoxin system death-on-curing family toxin [Clostridia bacterium]
MIKFNNEIILSLQNLIISNSGGTNGIRDINLLDSAVQSAFQTFGGFDLYPTIEEKGARLGYNLISNHAFLDGNKRIGILVMLCFFEINNINLNLTDDDIIYLGLGIADGSINYENLLNFIKNHIIF